LTTIQPPATTQGPCPFDRRPFLPLSGLTRGNKRCQLWAVTLLAFTRSAAFSLPRLHWFPHCLKPFFFGGGRPAPARPPHQKPPPYCPGFAGPFIFFDFVELALRLNSLCSHLVVGVAESKEAIGTCGAIRWVFCSQLPAPISDLNPNSGQKRLPPPARIPPPQPHSTSARSSPPTMAAQHLPLRAKNTATLETSRHHVLRAKRQEKGWRL
jgi:hypothetical protein